MPRIFSLLLPAYSFAAGLGLWLLTVATPLQAQTLNNDGFHRRNGQMHVLRNGQLRAMPRDARLPTGAVVTKDGFIVRPDGQRVELREGQGCDFRGNVVTVKTTDHGLALGPVRAAKRRAEPSSVDVRTVLNELLGGRRSDDDDEREYDRKDEEHARERRKREEERQREDEKRREEYFRERAKKWKEKWKEGKGWDD